MKVTLIEHTKLSNACIAGRTCWNSFHKGGNYNTPTDAITTTDKEFLNRIINKYKHKSISEHLVYTLSIDGISRACLQEVARHRIASYSVKSTRYTLKELKEVGDVFGAYDEDAGDYNIDLCRKFVIFTGDDITDGYICANLYNLQRQLKENKVSVDMNKLMLPEAYKTSLIMTINARSLQNFLFLRTDKAAFWEIRELAYAIYKSLPEEHKYLFKEYIKE